MAEFTDKDVENLKQALEALKKSSDPKTAKRIQETLNKLGDDTKDACDKLNEFASQTSQAARAADELEHSFGRVSSFQEKYYSTLNRVDDRISFFTESFGRNLANILGGSLGVTIMMALQDQTAMYRELVDVGQTFNGNMLNMNRAAFTAGLTLDQFAILVKSAGESAALLGMARFADLNKNVRSALLNFGSFGMSIQEVNESFANYVESQRISGTIQKFTNEELQRGFQSLAENAAFYAEITGKSAKELRAAVVDVRNNALGFQAFLQTLPREMQSTVQRQFDSVTAGLVAVFGDAGRRLSQELGDSLAYGSAAFSETARMLTMISPQVGSSLQELVEANRRGTLTEQRRTEIMNRVVKDLGNLGPETMQYLAMLQNHPAHREFATQIIQMANAARSQRELTEEQLNEQRRREALQNRFSETTQQLLNQQQQFQLATAQFKLLFVNIINPLFTILGPALSHFNEALSAVGSMLNSLFESLPDFVQVTIGVVGVMALLLPAFRGLIAGATRATAALLGIGGGVFGGAARRGAATAAAGGFGSALGRGAGTAAGAAGGSILGRGAGAAAGGFGRLASFGAMSAGLIAAVKPIAIVTLGLMALGKALEWVGIGVKSMAEGFAKLGEINAEGLWEFTKAAIALGPVLAGAGLGSMIGGLASSLSNLFSGGESQIASFERLAASGPGLSSVASALQTMQNLNLSGSIVQLDQLTSAIERMNRVSASIPDIKLPAVVENTAVPVSSMSLRNETYQIISSINVIASRLEELIELTRSGNSTRDDLTTAVRRMR